jgi:hypothetical protein
MGEQPVRLSKRPSARDKELEDDDPYELAGVRYPIAPGDDADRDTARTIIEEFALQGWNRLSIANLFADPHAGHVHSIYRRRAGALLDELFDEVFGTNRNGT